MQRFLTRLHLGPTTRIGIAVFFLCVTATEAFACPVCTYDRMLVERWHAKYVLITVFVPLLVVANRLDIIRFLYVLIPYAFFSFEFHSFLFWRTFAWRDWPLQLLATAGWWIWGLNLAGVGLLYAIRPIKFFRWNKEKGLARWQPIVYAVAATTISLIML